jgi:enamine deaminase RidA (YjgF/YER057c/UK114 family)
MAITASNPAGLFDGAPAGMSQVASARGRLVIVSGQVALDERGKVVGVGDFEAQAVRVFENLRTALAAAGASFEDVIRLGSFITDPKNLATLRAVRMRYLKAPFPASTGVVTALVLPELLLEVEAMAVVAD